MPYYPDELIEEIRSRNDIVDVVSSHVKLQKKGGTYFGLCPFHNERTPSFSVSPGKQMYHCFGCGESGNVITFVMKYENYGFLDALALLADRAGIELPKREMSRQEQERQEVKTRILEVNKEAAKYFYAQLWLHRERSAMERETEALAYLEGRGLSLATMKRFGLGYANHYSDDLYQYLRRKGYGSELLKESGLVKLDEAKGGRDRFWNRVMFPIMDVNHRVIGFGGRLMGPGEPKYLNSPETRVFDKSRNLYAINFARTSKKPGLLLCEGNMDVIALHQAGFDNAVASLGTSVTQGHAKLLKRFAKEVYLAFDNDGPGIKAALRAITILKDSGLVVKVIDLAPHKDPDDFINALGAEAFQERIDRAQNSFFYEISVLESQFDLEDPEEKTAFHRGIARKMLGFEQELERENYIEAVAGRYGIGVSRLRDLIHHMAYVDSQNARPRQTLKSGIQGKKGKIGPEGGIMQSQKLLLAWLAEGDRHVERIKPYLGPEDFSEGIYREVAAYLFEQYSNGQAPDPAKIVSMFQEEEKQRTVAALFHAKIGENLTKQEEEKALKECLVRIKQNGINQSAKRLEPADPAGFQKLLEDKRKLEMLQNLRLNISTD